MPLLKIADRMVNPEQIALVLREANGRRLCLRMTGHWTIDIVGDAAVAAWERLSREAEAIEGPAESDAPTPNPESRAG